MAERTDPFRLNTSKRQMRLSRDKAKPGPSQHHTGTAVRINDPEGLLDFADHVLNPPARYTVPLKIGTRFGIRLQNAVPQRGKEEGPLGDSEMLPVDDNGEGHVFWV